VREIRMLRATWRELETGPWDGLRHRQMAKAAGKQLFPIPTATAPVLDPTARGASGNRRPYRGGMSTTGVERRYASNSGHWQKSVCISYTHHHGERR
jgi:hypothetical protein